MVYLPDSTPDIMIKKIVIDVPTFQAIPHHSGRLMNFYPNASMEAAIKEPTEGHFG